DPADREAVAPVHVGHRDRGAHDPGQAGDVGDLLGGLVLPDRFHAPLVGVDDAVHAHRPGARDAPARLVEALEADLRRVHGAGLYRTICRTDSMPGRDRRISSAEAGISLSTAIIARAVFEAASRPSAIEAMFTSASPRIVPTAPTTPGTSALRKKRKCPGASGASIGMPSTETSRAPAGWKCVPPTN